MTHLVFPAPARPARFRTWAQWIGLMATAIRVEFQRALLALGGASLGLYYWFAAPVIVGATGGGDAAVTTIRALAAILIVVQRREPRNNT